MDAATIIILIVIALVLIIAVPAAISANRRKQQKELKQNVLEQGLFIPKGRVSHNQLGPAKPLVPQQQQMKTAFTTQNFAGRGQDRTLTGTCFLTGMPRSSCHCDECVKKRKGA